MLLLVNTLLAVMFSDFYFYRHEGDSFLVTRLSRFIKRSKDRSQVGSEVSIGRFIITALFLYFCYWTSYNLFLLIFPDKAWIAIALSVLLVMF